MSVHTHTLRNWCAIALVLIPVPLLLGWASVRESKEYESAQVSGRVTWAGQPFSGAIYFVSDDERGVPAMGTVKADGSFHMFVNGYRDRYGVVPGTYRIIVRPRVPDKTGSRVVSKYQDPRTTDLRVHIGMDWNYVTLNLH